MTQSSFRKGQQESRHSVMAVADSTEPPHSAMVKVHQFYGIYATTVKIIFLHVRIRKSTLNHLVLSIEFIVLRPSLSILSLNISNKELLYSRISNDILYVVDRAHITVGYTL